MNRQREYFNELCSPHYLLHAWKVVRANRGAAGIDLETIYQFERDLERKIGDLAARLRDGRYLPMPFIQFTRRKADGSTRTLAIGTVEDRIVARAIHDLLARLWEPTFLACSYGFRPDRNAEMAVKRVLEYRAAGDAWVLDADIAACFDELDHDVMLGLISQRLRDKRVLGLVRLLLSAGAAAPTATATDAAPPLAERAADFATSAVNDALASWMGTSHAAYDYAAYPPPGALHANALSSDADDAHEASADPSAELRKAARRAALKKLGQNAALLGLSYVGRASRLLSPATLAVTGAAVLATAAYPSAARFVRERWGAQATGTGAPQGSALSPLLANIVLHELDVVMVRAGFHFVRYADDWVVTAPDQVTAERALQVAARQLAELRLRVNPAKTRIVRFEQGLTFLGYTFDRFQLTATPAPTASQGPISVLRRAAPAAARELKETVAPHVARLGRITAQQFKRHAHRFKRNREK